MLIEVFASSIGKYWKSDKVSDEDILDTVKSPTTLVLLVLKQTLRYKGHLIRSIESSGMHYCLE